MSSSFESEPLDSASEVFYSAELRRVAIARRTASAHRLLELVGMTERQMALEGSDDEWLIARDFRETRHPSINYGSAIGYVEDLDRVRLSMRTGNDERRGE